MKSSLPVAVWLLPLPTLARVYWRNVCWLCWLCGCVVVPVQVDVCDDDDQCDFLLSITSMEGEGKAMGKEEREEREEREK